MLKRSLGLVAVVLLLAGATTVSGPLTFQNTFSVVAGAVDIAANAVTNAMLAPMPARSFKCNTAASAGGAADCGWANLPPAPNLLVNPAMEIDQANEGASVTLTSGATPLYIVDGWTAQYSSTATGIACQRVADAPAGFTDSLKCTVGAGAVSIAAGDYFVLTQPVEANQLAGAAFGTASAKTVCAALQVKSSIASYVATVALLNGAATRAYVQTIAGGAAGAWTPVGFCLPGDTAGTWLASGSGSGMTFRVAIADGSSRQIAAGTWQASGFDGASGMTNTVLTTTGASFQVAAAKLEIAPAPTPFLRRDVAAELAQAQRYYEKSYDLGTAPGTVAAAGSDSLYVVGATGGGKTAVFRVAKRCDPAVTMYSTATGAAGKVRDAQNAADVAVTTGSPGQYGFFWSAAPSLGSTVNLSGQWVADCRL